MYIDSDKESDDKYPKFVVSDHVAISKFRNIFAKSYTQNLSEKVLWSKKLRILHHGQTLLMILMVKKLLECFIRMSCKGQIKKNLGWKR